MKRENKEQVMKLNFLRMFIAVVTFFSINFSVVSAQSGAIGAVTLTWVEDARTTQTITWRSGLDSPDIYLEYSEADTPDAEISSVRTAKADTSLFATDQGSIRINTATVRGLKPGTRYVYRIGDGKNWVKDGMFTTEKAEEGFKFLLFGDSQSIDYNVWKTTFENACRNHLDARFFVNVGDLVDNGQSDTQWQAWHRSVAAYANRLPVVPVVGNHETYTPDGTFSMPRFFTEQFSLPQNGPEGLKEQVYSFDYGDVHIVVLDSQFGEERRFLPDSLERQKAWLAADLAETDKFWKIVFTHRPLYHNRMNEAYPDGNMAQFASVFEQYGVDAVFSGHDHVNARTPKLRAGVSSPQGIVYATVGRSGTKTYQTVGPKSWNEQFANPLNQPTYNVVSVMGNVFYVQVFKLDGSLLDEWSLTKLHR